MKDFRLGDIRATTCTRASGYLHVTGTAVRMPVTVVRGADEGPVVLVTGGVHGGEYPGIEAAIRLAGSLEPEQVRGTVVAVHPVSLPAFHARQQYLVPDDGKNLNRQFPGKACGTVSERMAWTLMEVARRADAWVDLHGGDIHEALVPFMIYSDVADPEVVAASRSMAEVYGIENVIASASVKGGTYSAAAAEGIPCILAEAGQVGQLDDESVAVHLRGCRNVLRHVGCLPGTPSPRAPCAPCGGSNGASPGRTAAGTPRCDSDRRSRRVSPSVWCATTSATPSRSTAPPPRASCSFWSRRWP